MKPRIFLTGLLGLVGFVVAGLILYPILKLLLIGLLVALGVAVVLAVAWIWFSSLDWLDFLFLWLDWF
jgi:hypothetical protein